MTKIWVDYFKIQDYVSNYVHMHLYVVYLNLLCPQYLIRVYYFIKHVVIVNFSLCSMGVYAISWGSTKGTLKTDSLF